MFQSRLVFLAVAFAPPSGTLHAQSDTAVEVFISGDTCHVRNSDVPCAVVGAKLVELGTPLDANIRIKGDSRSTYKATASALESLRAAGFKLKLGYVDSEQ
jgi:biopolymer transport protein ExbD